MNFFFAYPSQNNSIKTAANQLSMLPGGEKVLLWEQLDIPGQFIASEVLSNIDKKDVFIADITYFNFNVLYEIGFAIGLGKPILLVKNKTISNDNFDQIGILDTIGWVDYSNAPELMALIEASVKNTPLYSKPYPLNKRTPVYLVDALYKTDFHLRINSKLKKSGLGFRSFDPEEISRLSPAEAIKNVSESAGIVVSLLPKENKDAERHNLRSAFCAGLAEGMCKERLILQLGDEPVPLDYRELAKSSQTLNLIETEINDFIPVVYKHATEDDESITKTNFSNLEKFHIGSSAAENEFKTLQDYYIEIDAYNKCCEGNVRIVLGRKGVGKSALFFQSRNRLRSNKNNIVVDLKPETYTLIKLKEKVLKILSEGAMEHLLVAFWEYVLLLEVAYKLLEKDHKIYMRNHEIHGRYNALNDFYNSASLDQNGDFSERLNSVVMNVVREFEKKGITTLENKTLSHSDITQLLYQHDLKNLKALIRNYLSIKEGVWVFIDNLDKGWSTHGLEKIDLIILRTLLEASRKLERTYAQADFNFSTTVFLRNDVYELLIEQQADRGKESSVLLDWSDSDMMREMIRRRMVYAGLPNTGEFSSAWSNICVSHIDGEDSFQYLVELT